jgi:molybdenum cofactor cytidylyltransferase
MQLVRIDAAGSVEALPPTGVLCHDVRDPQSQTTVLARKGTLLERAELTGLLERLGTGEVHLAVPDAGDLAEDEAAVRLAVAVAGPGVRIGEAGYGQVTLTSDIRGLLRVDAARLERVNAHDGVLVLTSLADVPADEDMPVGVVKCAPLFLGDDVLRAVEAIRTSLGPVVDVERFRPHAVAFVAPTGRVRGNAFQRAASSLAHALEWYGSTLGPTVATDTSTAGVAEGCRTALESGPDLIFAAGAAATDPADLVFEGLRRAGGEVEQIGIPAEPGTACWIGQLAGRAVLGLASCELFGQPGALDILLPRLLAGEALDRQLLRRIAAGGLLLGGPSRVAPYHRAGE